LNGPPRLTLVERELPPPTIMKSVRSSARAVARTCCAAAALLASPFASPLAAADLGAVEFGAVEFAVGAATLGSSSVPMLVRPQQGAAQRRAGRQRSAAARRKSTAAKPRRTRSSRLRQVQQPVAVPIVAVRHTAPRSADALARDLAFMIESRTRSGEWGASVVSLTRGDTLFSHNADRQFLPASTMKLMTTAIALDRFGPQYQFSTDVLRDGTVAPDGTLHGNLILRGDGDPALSNRFLRGDANAPMELLARFVAGQGIKRVTGDIVGDASAFDPQKVPAGWLPRYLQAGYAARVSALSLNENLVWVAAYPAAGRGPARVVLEPSTSTIPLTANVRTVPGSRGGSIAVSRTGDGRVVARGWIGSRSIPRKYSLVVEDPASFATGAFREALIAQGIAVGGQVRLGETPATAVKVTALPSPPLARLVSVMNRESINHYAELLFRNAARGTRRTNLGSAENGAKTLQHFLVEKAGVPAGAVIAADGSGLSTLDSLTPRAMVHLLGYAHQAPWASAFHASLPVAGESELLRHRMRYTPAQGNLHAKTGTTNGVISLAGYVTAQDGEVLAFHFVYNGTDRWHARETIDVMGATLAGFERP
jgi:serine-type D-Ala-D-Ala carboxypeptidase/endopeptidase (penicillin-binding protein 4)